MLIELLLVCGMLAVVVGATLSVLEASSRQENRDQAYAQEIADTTTSLARLTHDLRQATQIVNASPNSIEFYMPGTANGVPVIYDVRYDCTAPDAKGASYTRCATVSSVYPTPLPTIPASAGTNDIVHVTNGRIATYCTADGSNQSGSVFFYRNPNVPDTNASAPACDESYVARVASTPTYVELRVAIPASGDLAPGEGGLAHITVLDGGAYIRNLDLNS